MRFLKLAVAAGSLALSAASAFAGQALEDMQGFWSSGSCAQAGEWRVYGDEIEFAWPGRPVDVERVVSETDSRVDTIGVSPEINGVRFTYFLSPDGNTIWIRDHRTNVDEVVRRCR